MLKKLLLLFLIPFVSFAQIPDYYNSIDISQSGDELKEQLSTLISTTHTFDLPYSSSSTDTWDVLKTSDLDPENSANVLLVYGYDNADSDTRNDRTRSKDDSCHSSSCRGLWNREHVFPKSKANPSLSTRDPGPGTDTHNLRACDSQFNSSRSNRIFEDATGNAHITPEGNFYPGDEWKGDVARIIMYMYLRYPTQCEAINVGVGARTNADIPDVFLKWNAEDPISEHEINRNEEIAAVQGNRNPFIDNPYLATRIWDGPDAENTWNTLSTDEFVQEKAVLIYPTITNTELTFQMNTSTDTSVVIYNVSGQKIYQNTINSTQKIDVVDYSKGMYFLHYSINGANYQQKFIKN